MAAKRKTPVRSGNGWERWRGEMTERVDNLGFGQERIEAAIKELAGKVETHAASVATGMSDHQKSDDTQFSTVKSKIAAMKVKVGLLMAGGGLVIGALVHKVFGG